MDGLDDSATERLLALSVAGLLGGIFALAILVTLALAPFALGALAWGGGAGGGCRPTAPGAAAVATATATGTPTTSSAQATPRPPCPPGGPHAGAVVAAAFAMAAHLHGDPDVWYDSGFPPAAILFWEQTCPGCWEWQNGELQCVMFATAAYGLAADPLPAAGNAIDFWALYHSRPGWFEIPSGASPRGQRGLPAPGDLMVWFNSNEPILGHIAVVVGLSPPSGGRSGELTFAEANGPAPIITTELLPDLSVATWPHYTVLGYIRQT